MCIMASPVRVVADTFIFVGRDDSLTRQLTVYAMSVELRDRTGKGNAMILPVPVGTHGVGSIALHDLSKAPDFFVPLSEAFIERSRGMSKGMGPDDAFDTLAVERVGNYDVSLVPTVDDVKRLNTAVFDVSADTEHTLRTEYALGFAFVVAQLRTSGDFHPIAYSHPYGGALFVPTRHEHGTVGTAELPRWDHKIFWLGSAKPVHLQALRNFASTRMVTGYAAEQCIGDVRREVAPHAPALLPFLREGQPVSRLFAQGPLPNVDLVIEGT